MKHEASFNITKSFRYYLRRLYLCHLQLHCASRLTVEILRSWRKKKKIEKARTYRVCRRKDISWTVKKRTFRRSGWRKKSARG